MPDRSARALRAAAEIIRQLGVGHVRPRLLNDANNVSIQLAPLPIVARVFGAVFGASGDGGARAARELAVALHLARKGAPIVPPVSALPPGPHLVDGLAVTLWQFVEHRPAEERDSGAAARALRLVHDALMDFPGVLPAFGETSRRARGLLDGPSALPALPSPDSAFLVAAHARIMARLAAFSMPALPIHGDTHLGNVMITPDGPRWTAFETACRGPLEWDIGFFPEADSSLFAPFDHELYDALADLRGLCVAVWCFARYDVPEKREAADFHLGWLKQRAAAAIPRSAADRI